MSHLFLILQASTLGRILHLSLVFFPAFVAFYAGVVYCLPPLSKLVYARFPWLRYDYRKRRINPREICPGCGFAGRKDMKFNPVEKRLILQCPRCMSCWSHEPLLNPSVWVKTPEAE